MGVLLEGSLVVKHTFLEFVTSPRAQAGRARHFTDTHLLESVSRPVYIECALPSVQPPVLAASPALAPAWPMTPALDALCEPDLGSLGLGGAENGEALLGMGMWPGSLDDTSCQQWLLPAAFWPESLEAAYQQPWVWMPMADVGETGTLEGAFWADPAAWMSSPASASASTKVDSDVGSSSEEDDSKVPAGETRTTVMLRSVPTSLTRNMLLHMLERLGFSGSFDLVYVPVDFGTGAGLGYAFVNLVSPTKVPAFWQAWDGLAAWGGVESDNVCSVSWSEPNQGLAAHIERYRNSPVMHPATPDEWRPALFSKGVRVEFPAPTKKIKAPKVRGKKVEDA